MPTPLFGTVAGMDWLTSNIGDAPLWWLLVALVLPQIVAVLITWLGNRNARTIAERNNMVAVSTAKDSNQTALNIAKLTNSTHLLATEETISSTIGSDHNKWLRENKTRVYKNFLQLSQELIERLSDVQNEDFDENVRTAHESHRSIMGELRLFGSPEILEHAHAIMKALGELNENNREFRNMSLEIDGITTEAEAEGDKETLSRAVEEMRERAEKLHQAIDSWPDKYGQRFALLTSAMVEDLHRAVSHESSLVQERTTPDQSTTDQPGVAEKT